MCLITINRISTTTKKEISLLGRKRVYPIGVSGAYYIEFLGEKKLANLKTGDVVIFIKTESTPEPTVKILGDFFNRRQQTWFNKYQRVDVEVVRNHKIAKHLSYTTGDKAIKTKLLKEERVGFSKWYGMLPWIK